MSSTKEFMLHYPDGSVASQKQLKREKPDAFLLECSNDTRYWVSLEVLPYAQYKVVKEKASYIKIDGKICQLPNIMVLYAIGKKFNVINALRKELRLPSMIAGKYWAKAISSFPRDLGLAIMPEKTKTCYAQDQFVKMMGFAVVEITDDKYCENQRTIAKGKEKSKEVKVENLISKNEKTRTIRMKA